MNPLRIETAIGYQYLLQKSQDEMGHVFRRAAFEAGKNLSEAREMAAIAARQNHSAARKGAMTQCKSPPARKSAG